MAQQEPIQSIRELRQTFGVLSDQALELATSLRACVCGADTHAEDGEGLDAMVQELLDVRQRVGGCICGPPCDGTSVDDVTKDFLRSMLTRLERQAALLDENLEECGCAKREEVEPPQPVSSPRTLMGLPGEIRNMIWWRTLVDDPQLVRITPRPVHAGRPLSRTPFHPQQRFSVPGLNNQGWTWERAGEEAMQDGWALLHVNREVYREAEAEFWRRAMDGNVMLSFGAPQGVGDMIRSRRYFGIGAAWTFFRDRPAETLRNIRRVHLDLRTRDRDWGGAARQALEVRRSFGVVNWGNYADRLLDLMRTDLTGLRHLSLTIGGYVPDVRQTPVSGPMCPCSRLVLTVSLSGLKPFRGGPPFSHPHRALSTGLRAWPA